MTRHMNRSWVVMFFVAAFIPALALAQEVNCKCSGVSPDSFGISGSWAPDFVFGNYTYNGFVKENLTCASGNISACRTCYGYKVYTGANYGTVVSSQNSLNTQNFDCGVTTSIGYDLAIHGLSFNTSYKLECLFNCPDADGTCPASPAEGASCYTTFTIQN